MECSFCHTLLREQRTEALNSLACEQAARAGSGKSKALTSNLRQLVGNEFTVVIHRYRLNSMKYGEVVINYISSLWSRIKYIPPCPPTKLIKITLSFSLI